MFLPLTWVLLPTTTCDPCVTPMPLPALSRLQSRLPPGTPSSLQMVPSSLQSYRHQDSMVLAQKQKYGPMEQDRKPRNKSMHLRTPYL